MPGSRGEITVDDQNGVDNDHKRRRKKKEGEDGTETENQLVMPSISKPRKRFIDKFRKRPKSQNQSSSSSSSRSGSRKGGCFSLRRRRRRTEEEEEEEGSPSSPVSDPNDECFTHEMLRVMLETNDFCSNECNPHRQLGKCLDLMGSWIMPTLDVLEDIQKTHGLLIPPELRTWHSRCLLASLVLLMFSRSQVALQTVTKTILILKRKMKVEMKVDINCGKCKNAIMQAVAEIEGVNQVVLDEEKSLLTVVGTMDPICVAEKLRKIKQKPVVVNIGPPKPPEAKTVPQPVCCKPCPPYCPPLYCPPYYNNNCDMVTVSTYSKGSGCTIV
ncbi:unnamed protein product [Brassica oleracea]